jgi:hypothetical protein
VDPDPNPTPDPTPFFIDFKDAKKYFLHIFLITYPQAHHLQSKKIKFFAKILFCGHHFSPLHTFMRKKEDLEPDPDPALYLRLMDPDPGGPKTCGSCGSGSPTLTDRPHKKI